MASNAELERRVKALERKLDEVLRELQSRPLPQRVAEPLPSYPQQPVWPVVPQYPNVYPGNAAQPTCGCPANTVCMSAFCPRVARRITSSVVPTSRSDTRVDL